MRVTVVHNEDAGHSGVGRDELTRWIAGAGYDPRFCIVEDVEACTAALRDPGDLVVVAGGDGSVRAVGQVLMGRQVPLTILPMGTANNVATHLGITADPQVLVEGWSRATLVRFDAGRVHAPWGDSVFFESCGFGALARTMAALTPVPAPCSEDGTPDDELMRDLRVAREMLADHPLHTCRVAIDGDAVDGRFVVVEVMNTSTLGPRIALSPSARSSDGLLDVILVDNDGRRLLREYLTARLEETPAVLDLPVRRAREVTLTWEGSRVHVDDELWPDEEAAAQGTYWADGAAVKISASAVPDALTFLVPPR